MAGDHRRLDRLRRCSPTARGGGVFTLTPGARPRRHVLAADPAPNATATYDDPQADAGGYKHVDAARGANCATVTDRQRARPTRSVTGARRRASTTRVGYGICTLTYDLAFDDNAVVYCTSDAEQRKARTVKDYLTKAVLSAAGPGRHCRRSDYAALPGATDARRRRARRRRADRLEQGRPGPSVLDAAAGPAPDADADADPGAGRRQHPARRRRRPRPATSSRSPRRASAAPRSASRCSSRARASSRIASSTKPKKGKAIKLAAKTVTRRQGRRADASRSALSSKAKSALRKDKRLKVTLKITYTPTGGTAKTVTQTVTVKQPKKK